MTNNNHGSITSSPVGDLLHSEFHQELACARKNSVDSPKSVAQYSTNLGGRRRYISSSKSVASSTSSRTSRPGYDSNSALDNPLFAPPPSLTSNTADTMEIIKTSRHRRVKSALPLPSFDKVTHSGLMMARISLTSLVMKKWKQVFWISYGDSEIYMFRSKIDFEEWATNPYLTTIERQEMVKLKVDFKIKSNCSSGIRCYRAFSLQGKNYGKSGLMHTFKLEQWMHYGPVILGAFASISQTEISAFHTICKEIIKRQKCSLKHYLSPIKTNDLDDQSQRSFHSTRSAPNTISPGFY